MPSFLFRSRWIAVVWVAGVLSAVAFFFGGGGRDLLDQAVENARARKAAVEMHVDSPPVIVAAPPQVVVRRITPDDLAESLPDEPGRYPSGSEDAQPLEQPRAEGEMPFDEGEVASDSYVVVEGAAAVENATADDLDRHRGDGRTGR